MPSDYAIEFLAKFWVRSFKAKPILTVVITILLVSIPIAGTIIDSHLSYKRRFEKQYSDPVIGSQLAELDKISSNLKELSVFLSLQEERVTAQHEALKKLQDEKQQLEPIVNAQKQLVDSIFALQEKKKAKQKYWDVGLGFILGIISSVIGSFIFAVIRVKKAESNEGKLDTNA